VKKKFEQMKVDFSFQKTCDLLMYGRRHGYLNVSF